MFNKQQLREFVVLWQVYRSHQITALKVSGFQLCKSTVYETEVKPLLGAEFSKSPTQQTEFAVPFASVRGFATLACNLTGGYVQPCPPLPPLVSFFVFQFKE